jgi:hypothetical protein
MVYRVYTRTEVQVVCKSAEIDDRNQTLLIHPLEQLTSAEHTRQSEGHCQNIFVFLEQLRGTSAKMRDEQPQRMA